MVVQRPPDVQDGSPSDEAKNVNEPLPDFQNGLKIHNSLVEITNLHQQSMTKQVQPKFAHLIGFNDFTLFNSDLFFISQQFYAPNHRFNPQSRHICQILPCSL